MILDKSNVELTCGDPKIWESISDGDTDFVFQFSSGGMKNILKQVRPKDITTLAEINALFRPGPLESGLVDKYIALKTTGTADLTKEEEIMYHILKKEFGENHSGLLVFQEDVMRICQIGAGFTLSEADDVRKAMGKKKSEVLQKYADKFIKGWKLEGDPEAIWKMLENYSHYAFNKSHSVAYAIIAYATARLWYYEKYKTLEYHLNLNSNEKFDIAIDNCKKLGVKYEFPKYNNAIGNNYTFIDGNKLLLPGRAKKNYRSPVELLFNDEVDYKLIYEGLCDCVSKDRMALAEISSSCLKKARELAYYMEGENEVFLNIEQILDGLIASGGVVKYERKSDGIHVFMKRFRGDPNEIIIHNDNSKEVIANMYKFDIKYFGHPRPGIVSKMPDINTNSIINTLNNIKTRMLGMNKDPYYNMRNKLEEYMHNNYSSTYRNTFTDIYAVLKDFKTFERSTKIYLDFADKSDIFYVNGECEKIIKTLPEDSLIKITMVYSPFISRKKLEFVYDFDITNIEVIS